MSTCGVGGWGGPLPGDPSSTFIFTATAAFGGIDLNWTYPATNPHAVAYTKLYRSATENPLTAVFLADRTGGFFHDRIATATQYYYWARMVSINGTEGDLVGPATAVALPTRTAMIELLTGEIDRGILANSLKTELDQISTINTNLINEITDRETGETTLADALADVAAGLAEAHTFIINETASRVLADSALVEQIDGVVATLGDDVAAVIVTMTADIDAVTGSVDAMYTAKVTVNGLVGGFGIHNDGDEVEAGFDVDTFWVGRTDLDKIKPFIITGGIVYIAEAVIPILSADKIDTTNLTIRDADGDIIFGSGATVNPATYMVVPTGWLNSNQTWTEVTGSGKPADNATVGATWNVNVSGIPANLAGLTGFEGILNSSITLSGLGAGAMASINALTIANASTYIDGAIINLANINIASIGTLAALSSYLGAVEIATGGYLRSGAKTYGSATPGFILDFSTADPRMDVGNSTQYMRWTGSALEIGGDIIATGNIKSGAVTGASGTSLVSDVVVTNLTETTVLSTTITTTGQPVGSWIKLRGTANDGGNSLSWYVRVYVDTVLVTEDTRGGDGPWSFVDSLYLTSLAAGSHTIEVKIAMIFSVGTGKSITSSASSGCSLFCLEFKR